MSNDPKTPGQQFGKADRAPSEDEEAAAARGRKDVDEDEVAEHYEEMADLGANVKGEGQIDPDR